MKQKAAWFIALSASLVLTGAAAGCGGDDSTPSPSTGSGASGGTGGTGGTMDAGNKAGGAGTGGSSGSGGTGGSGGAAGSGGAGGTTDAGPMGLKCGVKNCLPLDIEGMLLPACCPNGEMNTCGNRLATLCLTESLGTSDPSCPDVDIQGQIAPACCTATGVCGGQIGAPLGCNDLSPLFGGTPKPCGGDASTPPPDSSTPDSGPPPDAGPGNDGATRDATNEGGSDVATDRGPDAPSDARVDQAG